MSRGRHATASKNWPALSAFLILLAIASWRWLHEELSAGQWYGITVFCLLGVKFIVSTRAHRLRALGDDLAVVQSLRIGVLVPACNEDPQVLERALRTLISQTRPPDHVVLVIDPPAADKAEAVAASERTWRVAGELVSRFAQANIRFNVIEFPENRGKRHALAAGIAEMGEDMDVFLGVDSDTVLHPSAIEEGMAPFKDAHVHAVTGLVLALNATKNVLTRLIDLRYANAFLYERAAYSQAGSVLCACGSLAFYRAPTVRKYLNDFLNQTFLGQKATYGDDRRLTNYCLLEGKVLFQPSAIAWTLVPERIGHYLRQQIRWNKSFFRESLWVIRFMDSRKPAVWLTMIELASWALFTLAMLVSMVIVPFTAHATATTWGLYFFYMVLLGYVRSVRYLGVGAAHGITRRDRWIGYVISPLYALIHMLVLLPLRIYSLMTLRDNGWGTRSTIEVRLAE